MYTVGKAQTSFELTTRLIMQSLIFVTISLMAAYEKELIQAAPVNLTENGANIVEVY